MSETNVKREYKSTVFAMLYQGKKELLELYNGINGTNYDNPEDLQITTLENAIYMSMKNDASCMIDMSLQLYEQQSTVNPNMPARFLEYVAKQFEKLFVHHNMYSRKQVPIPTPKFYVFYNGEEEQPELRIMKLSDSFVKKERQYDLELVVRQYNINPGYNEELKKKCPTLMQYMEYVTRVRNHYKTKSLAEAVNLAINECIRDGILREFLQENKAEVVSMSIFEYDEEKHKKYLYEEGYEDGESAGYTKGENAGYAKGESAKLRTQVEKKLVKGYSVSEIADMLEEPEEGISKIVEELKK